MALSEEQTEGMALPVRMLSSVVTDREQWDRDRLAVWNYPLAAADTMATSVVNLIPQLTGFGPVVDSFVPASAERYHRNRYGYDAVGSTVAMLSGVGTVMRGVQLTGAAGRLAATKLGEDTARSMFSWMNEVRDVDNLMAAARMNHAVEVGSRLGRNNAILDLTATTSGTALAAYGRTYGEVNTWLRGARTTQAIKEGVAVEVAIAAMFNNSDFLFPDEAGPMAYLTLGGLGVGLNVGVEHLLGRAAMRRGLRGAAQAGEMAAAATRRAQGGTVDTGDTLFNVVGEEWQGVVAQLHGLDMVRQLEAAIPEISGRATNPIPAQTLEATVRSEEQAINTLLAGHITRMAKNRLNEPVLRNGVGNRAAVSVEYRLSPDELMATRSRLIENNTAAHGMAEIDDTQVGARYAVIQRDLQDQINKFQAEVDLGLAKMAPLEDIRAAQDALDNVRGQMNRLRQYRPAVLERTAVPNYNPNRRAPWEETSFANSAKVANSRGGLRFDAGPEGVPTMVLTKEGRLAHEKSTGGAGYFIHADRDVASLSFNESSALHALVDRAVTSKGWTEEFWKEFLQNPNLTYAKLPYHLLDALADGRMAVPEAMKGMPKAQRVLADLANGVISAESFIQKFDTAKALRAGKDFSVEDELDAFDLEKVLNMRLTDQRGMHNLLLDAITAFSRQELDARTVLGSAGHANSIFDSAFYLGRGFRDQLVDFATEEDFMKSAIRSLRSSNPDDKAQGIGVVYHNLRQPTDTDVQLAYVIRNRNAQREQAFFETAPELVRNVGLAMREDEVSFMGTQKGSEIFLDTTVRNNTLTQTTHANATQSALRHAHTQGQIAQNAIDMQKNEVLLPIVQFDRQLFADTTGQGARVFAEYGQAYQAVSRGIALVEDHYTAGLNLIDMSRPGAKHTLEILGPLKNAPDEGDAWHLFDMTIAANEGRYVPIQLSEVGAARLNATSAVQYKLLEAENFLRLQAGLPVKQKLRGHLPAPDFSRYEMRYIADPTTNRVVGYIKGRTPAEVDAEVLRALGSHNAKHPPENHLIEMKADQIREHYELTDQNFLSTLSDWSGYRQTGPGGGRNMDFRMPNPEEMLAEHMVAMRNSFDDIKDRTVTGVFSQAFSNTRRTAILNGSGGQPVGKKTFFTAAEQWENLLLARDRLPENSHARVAHDWVDSLYNTTVGRMTDILPWNMRAADAILNGTDNKILAKLTGRQRKYVEDAINNYQPFNALVNRPDLRDYFKGSVSNDPYKLRRNLQAANRVSAAMMLKHINIAHPILNMLGLVTTLPAVRSQLTRRANETAQQFAERIGYLADYIDPEKGFATINPAKSMLEGWHLLMNDRAAYEFAAKRGMLNANMLEEINKLNNYSQKSGADVIEGFLEMTDIYNRIINFGMRKAGKEPAAFSLSERSETFSRAIAHMVGLSIIRQSGREGLSEAAQHSFAHKFSNLNIADFAPNIRGEAFRGSAGIPFGLFQSYAINMYQRLFSYVADRDKRTLAIQALTQAGIFGMAGLPGWNQLNAMYFNQKDMKADERGATSLNERIHAALGKGPADFLMSGSVSSLPRLLGADTGLNLYSSGDLNFQAPVVPPAVSLAVQTFQGLSQGLKRTSEELSNLAAGRGMDASRIAEVMANYGPSRGFRSLADLAIGERIDRRGNLILEDTRSGVALLSRLLGVRTMNEMQVSAAMWDNSMAQTQRVADMASVRNQMLRRFRDGSLDHDTAVAWLDEYISAGGREDQWIRWLNYTADMATKTRDERALARVTTALSDIYQHQYASVQRLAASGTDIRAIIGMDSTGDEAARHGAVNADPTMVP